METWCKSARHCSTRPIKYTDPSGHRPADEEFDKRDSKNKANNSNKGKNNANKSSKDDSKKNDSKGNGKQNSDKSKKNEPIVTAPQTTSYGYGITCTTYTIEFSSKYDALKYIDGISGDEAYTPYVDLVTGLILDAFAKNTFPIITVVSGAASASIETGYNIMFKGVAEDIDNLNSEKVCITVTTWDIPQNHGFGYLDTYYTVSSW